MTGFAPSSIHEFYSKVTAVWEGREADVSFCEDLNIPLVQCEKLTGMSVLLAGDLVTDVHPDPAAFPWMPLASFQVCSAGELYTCAEVGNC